MSEEKIQDAPRLDEHRAAHPTGGFRHAVARTTEDSFAVEVQAGELAWTLDEPVTMGGHGAAPDPVTSFLGGLCGCLLISLRITARARQIPIGRATMAARANEKGFVKTIDVDLTVYSDAPEDQVRTAVERAEKGCYIRGLLKESIAYRLNLVVQPLAPVGGEE
jgi:uncharacterized OsmC-like protein